MLGVILYDFQYGSIIQGVCPMVVTETSEYSVINNDAVYLKKSPVTFIGTI